MIKFKLTAALMALSFLGMTQVEAVTKAPMQRAEGMPQRKAGLPVQPMPMGNQGMPKDCEEKCAGRDGNRFYKCVAKCDRCLDHNGGDMRKCLKSHHGKGKHHRHHQCKDANGDPTRCAHHRHHHKHGHHGHHGHHHKHHHGHHHHHHHDEAKTVAPEGAM